MEDANLVYTFKAPKPSVAAYNVLNQILLSEFLMKYLNF